MLILPAVFVAMTASVLIWLVFGSAHRNIRRLGHEIPDPNSGGAWHWLPGVAVCISWIFPVAGLLFQIKGFEEFRDTIWMFQKDIQNTLRNGILASLSPGALAFGTAGYLILVGRGPTKRAFVFLQLLLLALARSGLRDRVHSFA
ncbi:MAG: hypothetical protein L0Z50_14340 [Verrucomicrobiales bacterium]|nr:hypothetical protein [Verrucomicrobiales bacterium]